MAETEGKKDEPVKEEEATDIQDMFGAKKKKKKRSPFVMPGEEKPTPVEEDAAPDAGDGVSGATSVEEEALCFSETEPWNWLAGSRPYKYNELLDRMYDILRGKNPDLVGEKKRYVLKPPQIVREGTRKVVFLNFDEICQMMHRSKDHVLLFILTELGTTGSVDGSSRLVIRGRYTPKHIESLLKRYIAEYVKCKMCGLPDTELNRDPVTRLHFVKCRGCNSSRSVAPIKQGYQAQIGKRRRR